MYAHGNGQNFSPSGKVKSAEDFIAALSTIVDRIDVDDLIRQRTNRGRDYEDILSALGHDMIENDREIDPKTRYVLVREEVRNKAIALMHYALSR
jgi:hypothetical protein